MCSPAAKWRDGLSTWLGEVEITRWRCGMDKYGNETTAFRQRAEVPLRIPNDLKALARLFAAGIDAHLGDTAIGVVIGVLRGTKRGGVEVMDVIGEIADVVIRDTAQAGGQLEHAATGLVAGAIQAAKEMGVNAEDAASAAAQAVLTAADKVGSTAVETVRRALTQSISGIKVVLKAPFESAPAR